jgi:multidrug transporter EmrE-like cation transporter
MEHNINNQINLNNLNKNVNLDLLKWISLVVIAETVAQYNIKESLIKKSNMRFIFAIFGYTFVCLFLRQIYSNKGAVGITNVIWSIFSIVSILMIGIIFFHETLNKYDMFGIILCIIGLYFIYVKGHRTNNE